MITPSKEVIINEYAPALEKFLKERGLQISKSKSKIINLKGESLGYLGWEIKLMKRDLKRNKSSVNKKILILKPSKESVKRVKREMKRIFQSNKLIERIIKEINPVLRG